MAFALKMNLEGIIVYFKIHGYKPCDSAIWDEQWCKVDFSFSSKEWLNYCNENAEVLLSCEVEEIANKIEKLLHDELSEVTEVSFIEPDFNFCLYPKRDLRKDPAYFYIKEGHEIADIYMEWIVSFWDDGALTCNYLSVTLDRDDMQHLLNYLLLTTGKIEKDSAEVRRMIQDGLICE